MGFFGWLSSPRGSFSKALKGWACRRPGIHKNLVDNYQKFCEELNVKGTEEFYLASWVFMSAFLIHHTIGCSTGFIGMYFGMPEVSRFALVVDTITLPKLSDEADVFRLALRVVLVDHIA